MGYNEVFAPYKAAQKETVMQSTWGHLAPEKNKTYKGKLMFSISAFNSLNADLIDFEFNNLESSPWLFDAINNLMENWIDDLKLEDGAVYEANLTFRNYRFWGKPKQIIKFNY